MRGAASPTLLPLLLVGVVLTKQSEASYTSQYIMLEGDCPGPSILFVRNSVQVSLTSNPLRYNEGAWRRCSLTFQAQKSGHLLLLHWDAVRLSTSSDSSGIKVFVKEGNPMPTPGRGESDRNDYRSFSNQLTLHYMGYPHYDYLRVTITEIRFALSCNYDEFMCPRGPNSFCITRELLCNGENNCGDDNVSDENYIGCTESHATTTRPTDTPIPVGLVGALAAQPVIIIFLVTAFCIIKRRRERSKEVARMGSGLQRQTNPRNRPQNEYVTLPHSTSGTQQKILPSQPPLLRSTGVRTNPPAESPPPEPSPRRTLPPAPEEPETNYVNLHVGQHQMPLLFEVPDTYAVPLLHTMGLRKATVVQKTPPRYDPEVSISEPGYMEIDDADVVEPSHRKERTSPNAKVSSVSPNAKVSSGSPERL